MDASLSAATASVMAVTNVAEASAKKPQKWDKTVKYRFVELRKSVVDKEF